MLYRRHLSVACTFSWNHETNGLTVGGHFFTIRIESFVLEKPLYSGWYKKTLFCNYCKSTTITGLLDKELIHWYLSNILIIAIKHSVCLKPSKAMNHVLH